jgi:hypothetical protein
LNPRSVNSVYPSPPIDAHNGDNAASRATALNTENQNAKVKPAVTKQRFFPKLENQRAGSSTAPVAKLPKDGRNDGSGCVICATVKDIQIVRELGRGATRVAFEVVLPNGQHGVAKRCVANGTYTKRCNSMKDFHGKEARFVQMMREQFGDDALPYFGLCSFPLNTDTTDENWPENQLRDFSSGITTFFGMGSPLTDQAFTPSDFEALRVMARMYSALKPSPLLLGGDCSSPNQYIRGTKDNQHRIFQIDMAMLWTSKNRSEMLRRNCQFLFKNLAKVKRSEAVNCTRAYSRHLQDDALARGQTLMFPRISLVAPDYNESLHATC